MIKSGAGRGGGALGWLRRALGRGEGLGPAPDEPGAGPGAGERAPSFGPAGQRASRLGPYRAGGGAESRFSWSGEGGGHHRALAILERGHGYNAYLARRFGFGEREGLGVLVHFPDELSAARDRLRALVELHAYALLPRHPGIRRVFDAGAMGERSSARDDASFPNGRAGLFVGLDYVHGATLPDLLGRLYERGLRLPEASAARVVRGAALALAAAGAGRAFEGPPLGALHPDLRPSNLLVTFAGRPVVESFAAGLTRRGLPHPLDAGEQTTPEDVAYRAPEQLRGGPVDERASVFSLGAILHELLAGRPAFGAETVNETSRRVLAGDVREPLPGSALGRVAARALAVAPEARFPSLSAFAEALAQPAGDEPLAGVFLRHAMRALFAADITRREQLVRAALVADGVG